MVALFLFIVALLAANSGAIRLQSSVNSVQLVRSSDYGLTVRYSIDELNHKTVETKEGYYTDLYIKHYANTNKTGEPRLPLIRQIIQVPIGAEVHPRISTQNQMTINLGANGINHPIIPRQESLAKCDDPATAPFVVKHEFYTSTRWTSEPAVKVEELGMMRGVRLVALDFAPVRYNPGFGEIEVIVNAEVQVDFVGGDLRATEDLRARTYSSAFEPIYARTLLNYQPTRMSLNRYPLGYVIVTPQMFVSTLQPFIDWKKREGFNVTVATTEQIGNTTTAIKNFMQNLWDSSTTQHPAPSYLLLVGDTPQIPAFTGATGTGHVTDLNYVRLQGTDYVPEMYYGRFSATNVAELQPQVDKSLMHEMYTMPDDSYLAEVVMIAGVDSYYGNSHANGQINYGTNNYFNSTNGITSSTFLYPSSGSQAGAIVSAVSQGKGYVNYTAHGSETSWADPSFTITNINSLQNVNKYPVVVGNCCITNHFNTALCFGEAWLRAANKGAVIYIGGNNNTYWDEDYYWGVGYKPPAVSSGSPWIPNRTGVYDALFHSHGEPFEDWAGSTGAMIVMGNLAVTMSNSSRINYYWEIYSIMGDPSLVPYMGIPAVNQASYQQTLFLGLDSMQITADPYSYVAISMNNVLHGVGLADANGQLTLSFTPFETPGTAQVVMTRSNRRPHIGNIDVVPNVGPYVLVSNVGVNDGNNSIAEAGETVGLDVSFNNVGVQNATNLTAVMSTENQYVAVLQNTATIASVPANETIILPNAFTMMISPMIPDQEMVSFEVSISDGANTWTSTRNIVVNAPNVSFSGVTLNDANNNGVMESGETINITVNVSNTGSMNALGGTLNLVMNYPNASLSTTSLVTPGITSGSQIPLSFQVTLGTGIDDGTVVPIGLALNAGVQMINHTILIPVGLVGEGFESGGFTSFPWQNTSTQPWTVVQGATNVYSGNYAAKSGTISHNQNTALELVLNVAAAGNVSFYRKVSSEANYDFLKFYIDGTEMGSWSGTQDWAQFSYPVSPGNRTFRWVYSKDGSVNGGSDCAWIDEIVFPVAGDGSVAMFYTPTTEIAMIDVPLNATVGEDFAIRNLGNSALSGMILIPNGFVLSSSNQNLPSNYNYNIPANGTQIFTLSYTTGNQSLNISDMITITSNDAFNPAYAIDVTLQTAVSNPNDGLLPVITKLDGNYPNPFNPETAIRFSLKDASHVRISVFNIKGQLVKSLVDSNLTPGNHKVVWNGKDSNGRSVTSGIYLYRMETNDYNKTMKMMLMK